TRLAGRFVSTCGLKKIIGALGSHYQLVIVDQTGHSVSHVTEWYRLRQKQPGTDSTRIVVESLLRVDPVPSKNFKTYPPSSCQHTSNISIVSPGPKPKSRPRSACLGR